MNARLLILAALMMTLASSGASVSYYLRGDVGDDANDGTSPEKAFKTFPALWAKIKEGSKNDDQNFYIYPKADGSPLVYTVDWEAVDIPKKYNLARLHFIGMGASRTDVVFDGNGEKCKFFRDDTWYENSSICNMTFQNAKGGPALQIYWAGGVVSNCVFRNNAQAGLSMHSQDTTVVDCLFENNGSELYNAWGGALSYTQNPTADLYGSRAVIRNCTFKNNTNPAADKVSNGGFGGAVYAKTQRCDWLVEGCTFDGNSAVYDGGGLFIQRDQATTPDISIVIRECTFKNCRARMGGGLKIGWDERFWGGVDIVDCTFEDNEATEGAGGLMAPLNVCQGCTFTRNTAPIGGAYAFHYYSGPWTEDVDGVRPENGCAYRTTNTFVTCTFEGNVATTRGGALGWWYPNKFACSNCTFRANTCTKSDGTLKNNGGAAIQNLTDVQFHHLTVDDCVFEDHDLREVATGLTDAKNGGSTNHSVWRNCVFRNNQFGSKALMFFCNATVENCVFTNNVGTSEVVSINGWGNGSTGTLSTNSFVNCLWADNVNESTERAGVFRSDWQDFRGAVFDNCTMANNRAAMEPFGFFGAGLASYAAAHFRNCLVFGNRKTDGTTGLQVSNQFLNNGACENCWFEEGAQALLSDTALAACQSLTGTDPRFADSAAGDYRLTARSTARNAGKLLDWMVAGATDLSGVTPRVVGTLPDIGCYEFLSTSGLVIILR